MRFQERKVILAHAQTAGLFRSIVLRLTIPRTSDFQANALPFGFPGFQQFGEKECGKGLQRATKRTCAACFDALHMIMCGC
jgi:hypothetical protein